MGGEGATEKPVLKGESIRGTHHIHTKFLHFIYHKYLHGRPNSVVTQKPNGAKLTVTPTIFLFLGHCFMTDVVVG